MKERLNGLDLFSGIGGLAKALEPYVRAVAYCEIDSYARGVLLSRMLDGQLDVAPIWDDVQSLRGVMLPRIDIIYGGFPCQDISVAGNGGGLEGKRSGLFFEIVRLAKEIKPEFIFLENVPAIRTRGLGIVLQELTEAGYDCRWTMLSAADVGANHRRQRWFLLAHTSSKQSGRLQQSGVFTDTGRRSFDMADTESGRRIERNQVTGRSTEGTGTPRQRSGLADSSWWSVEPNVGRVANGISRRVDKLRCLGNAVVPAQAQKAFEILMGIYFLPNY